MGWGLGGGKIVFLGGHLIGLFLFQILLPYDVLFSHDAQRHRPTDDSSSGEYDRLKRFYFLYLGKKLKKRFNVLTDRSDAQRDQLTA